LRLVVVVERRMQVWESLAAAMSEFICMAHRG
jgi:hypothetical protein